MTTTQNQTTRNQNADTPAGGVMPPGPRMNAAGTEVGGKLFKRLQSVQQVVTAVMSESLLNLIDLRVSQINGCAYCLDMHSKDALAAGESPTRLVLVAGWREANCFTAPERAALALAEEGTRLADNSHGVTDQTWAGAREHFDDEQLTALVAQIAMINTWNRLNVIVRNTGGDYQPGMFG